MSSILNTIYGQCRKSCAFLSVERFSIGSNKKLQSLNVSSGATQHIFYKTKFSLQKLSSSPWTSAILTVKYKYATKHR